ncbi:MAG: LPS-assembly protein LptD [Flavobacteriales bacterium]|nr:LPS-assembly protein LptD [Flavobacteriales bacterium]
MFPARIGLFTLLMLTSLSSELFCQPDSLLLGNDTINNATKIENESYKSPIDEIITYPAKDSTIYDIASQTVHMYKGAKVTYGDISLEADYISYNFSKMEVTAYGLPDTNGTVLGKPLFKQGSQAFNSDTIRYNFTTEKGLIKKVVTNDGESYVHSEVSKKQADGDIHNYGGMYTTCNNEKPHYHFRFNKMIVKPNDKIVTGPVYMKIGQVPLPLGLPFGFFPNTTKQKAGILIPGYGQSQSLGFFLINGGYYLPIGEYMDTKLTGDIYSRGSWGLRSITNYTRRYKYNGNLDVSFNSILNGDRDLLGFTKSQNFFVKWAHRQDSKARPGVTFSGSVNAGTRNNFRNNLNSSQNDFISNQFASNVSYSKRWTNSQLNISGSHSQNTSTGNVSISLPQVGFNLNRFFLPLSFLRSSSAGAKKWYETIGVTYNSQFQNQLNTNDTLISMDNLSELSRQIVNGVRHNINANTSIKAGYVSITPSFRLTELWHFAQQEQFLVNDTTLVTDTLGGFFATRNYSMSANMTTKIYGMFNFKGDGLKAIRHVMTPSLGFSYSPEFDYRQELELNGEQMDYNPFVVSSYNQSAFGNEAASLNFNLQNNIEGKIKSRRDTSGSGMKKVKFIENLNVSTAYNLVADSLNLSRIRLTARTTPFKNSTIQYSSLYDPYQVDDQGRNINKFRWNGSGPILRALQHNVAFSTRLSGGKGERKKPIEEEAESTFASTEEIERIDNSSNQYVDFNTPWNLNLSYTLSLNNSFRVVGDDLRDTTITQQGILFNGDIRLFKKWKIGVNSGYDLSMQDWTATTVSLYWDLHCWEFQANVIPIGVRKSFNLRIGVKASVLQDLKLQRRGTFGDGQPLFQ